MKMQAIVFNDQILTKMAFKIFNGYNVQELADVKYSLLNEGLSISISKTKKGIFYYFLIIFCCT